MKINIKRKKVNRAGDAPIRKKGTDVVGLIMRILPEKLTGEPAELARRYGSARACGDPVAMSDAMRRKTASYYAVLLFAIVIAGFAAAQELTANVGIDADSVRREGFSGDAKFIEAQVNAKYSGVNVKKNVSVTVLPSQPTPAETADALEDLKGRLPSVILSDNAGLGSVTSDLDLITTDEKTGALINWNSDRPEAIDREGRVNLIEGNPGEKVTLSADITIGEATDDMNIVVVTGDPGAAHDYVNDLEDSVDQLVSGISDSADGRAVALPDSTESGVSVDWSVPRENGALIALFVIPPMAFLVYRNRYRGMDKAVIEMRAGISRDFPDFLAKLLLLLNAGLVVTAAVEKIAYDYKGRRRKGEEKVFFEELLGMEDRIKGANTSLSAEFAGLAARSGRREVMRFSAILADNIDKGSALADKLMQEEGMLRMMRKKRAEEKGRIAETKLTFPMVLQLGAIIIITIAPAAFEMQ